MEKDERLLPLPGGAKMQFPSNNEPAAYTPFYDEETFNEKRSLREYYIIVYKRLPLILAMTIIVTAVVAFYMYRQPSIYEAQTTMIIEPRKPKPQSKETVIFYGTDQNYYNTQLRLLQNPDLMQEVVIRLGLQRDPNLFSTQNQGVLASLRSMFSGSKAAETKDPSLSVITTENADGSPNVDVTALSPEEKQRAVSYAGILSGGLSVTQEEKTNLVNIRVQSTNPDVAAKAADMIAKTFIEQDAKRETQNAEQRLTDLSKSIEELRSTIVQQEQERIAYMKNSGLPLAEKGGELASSRLQKMSDDLLTSQDDRRKAQQSYEAAVEAAQKGQILSVVPDNKFLLDARAQQNRLRTELEKRIDDMGKQIQDLESEKSALLAKYTSEYPKVKEIEARIDSITQNREKTRAEVSQKVVSEATNLEKNAEKEVLTGLAAQLRSAQNREAQARGSYENEIASANQQGQSATRLTTLIRDIETNRNLLDSYTQSQKQQELANASNQPDNITITAKAVKPGAPIGPQRPRNILIALLISLGTGIGLAFLLDYLDDSIRSSDDIGRHLGLPALALIPHQNAAEKKRSLLTGKSSGSASTALISLEDNRSAMAEAFRHLRTSLLFSSAGKPPQTILITSSQPSEGKTTTALNTAITLAQSGADVVIIDCDLRRPRLHHHLNLDNVTGLTNYLSGERSPENLLKPCPSLPKLKVITSGPIPPNPAELLSSNEMKSLLQYLKGNFNHVVIDSPPAISFTDAAILSTLVDGVVIVAMAGKSSMHLIRRFKQRLNNLGARIYGVVLNGVRLNSLESGYYGYGYNYYEVPDDETTPLMEEEKASAQTGGR